MYKSTHKVHELKLQNMWICFTSFDARETGTRTAQTRVAPTNGKTPVLKVPKKSLYQNTVTELSQGKTMGVCNDINSVNSYPTHQHHDNSQKMPSNVTTAHSKQVVPQDLVTVQHTPVECAISAPNASVQSQCTTVENFSREEVVPLYIWVNRNSSKDYRKNLGVRLTIPPVIKSFERTKPRQISVFVSQKFIIHMLFRIFSCGPKIPRKKLIG